MTNKEAIERCYELLTFEKNIKDSFDVLIADGGSGVIVIDGGINGDNSIGPIYELMLFRSISFKSENGDIDVVYPEEHDSARLSRKIYVKFNDDWDLDETIVEEFDIKQIKRDYKLGLLGIKKK